MKIPVHNIGYREINGFLKRINEIREDSDVNISFEKDKKNPNFYGEINPVFLSYLILLYDEIPNLKIIIDFKESIDSDRFFAFAPLVKYVKYFYNNLINDDNLIIKGKYYNKAKDDDIPILESNIKLTSSKSYTPFLFIDFEKEEKDNRINYFFKNPINLRNKLSLLYYKKLISEIERLTKTKNKYNYLENTPFIEIVILNLLINDDNNLFSDLRKKDSSKKNKELINNLIKFTNDIAKGLKELALNFEHSTQRKGVISIRRFDRKRLIELKSEDEKNYLNQNNKIDNFLDINVIDLGAKNIKDSYVNNLKNTQKSFLRSLQKNANNYDILKTSIGIQFEDDIKIIEKKDYKFHNIFLSNNDSVSNLSIQKNKLISKIGLQFFTRLVKDRYKGYIKVSSLDKKAILYNVSDSEFIDIKDNESFIHFGAFYNSIIPIENWFEKKLKKITIDRRIGEKTNTFFELNNFNLADLKYNSEGKLTLSNYNNSEKNIILCSPKFTKKTHNKYENFINLYSKLYNYKEELSKNKKQNIIAISCKEIENIYIDNPSHWTRFIWTLTDFFENIILYDLNIKHFKLIIELRKLFNETGKISYDFWEEDSRVLFYSKKNLTKRSDENDNYYRYGANMLAGKDINQFNYLNTKIWIHHYSHKGEIFKLENDKDGIIKNELTSHFNSAFFNGLSENLHYFEVILKTLTKNEGNITLFEKSVQYSLNTELKDKISNETNNKGYKISNTHFRLGSKIHISDFYYAKKLFHNSFFTTPLSYSISEQIWEIIKHETNKEYSIIGYENYSSFLISSIRNFLEKKATKNNSQSLKINHSTIDKDGNLSREKHRLSKNIIIIVPIATTFSTSLKIEEQLNKIVNDKSNEGLYDFKRINVLKPTFNIVLVAHKKYDKSFMEDLIDNENNILKDPYISYNWKSINFETKDIIVERYNTFGNDDNERTQRYLIPVFTLWHKAEECRLCFPIDYRNEKCLVETGEASITPQLIFGFPKTKPSNPIKNHQFKGLSLEGSLLYGNLKNNHNRYLYYNRTGRIVKDNEKEIIKWIKNLYVVFNNDASYKSSFINKKIVLVVPNTSSRSKFLDLINEHLFDYTANSIIISINEDYIENSETLYADGLHNSETVIYIDDVLATIKSFNSVNKIVKYIRGKNKLGRGIDFCISLINRMSFSDEDDLLLKLNPIGKKEIEKKRLIYYHKIDNPTIEEANKEFPVELERKKYKYLEEISSLDQIRYYFHQKKEKIKVIDLKQNPTSFIKDYSFDFDKKGKRNKKLFQLLVLDAIYKLFECNSNCNNKDKVQKLQKIFPINTEDFQKKEATIEFKNIIVENAIKKLIDKIRIILNKDLKHKHIIEENSNNLEYVIFKVICSTPLIYYKEIRETALYWNLIKLDEIIKKIYSLNDFNVFELFKIQKDKQYSLLQDLKFLLKNSIKLKSNYIINDKFLEAFKNIIKNLKENETEIPFEKEKNKNNQFSNKLQALVNNAEYVNNPFIKIKLYDFIQGSFKDDILNTITFDNRIIQFKNKTYTIKDAQSGTIHNKKQIKDYHKNIIRDYSQYRNEILKENFQEGLFDTIEIPLIKNDDLEVFSTFKEEFDKLLNINKRYILPNESPTKSFIYQIVSLIQELLYKLETKSIKLDKIIDNKRNEIDDNENGTFQHFLRLLRLENIEIINKFVDEIINTLKIDKQLDYNYIEQNENNKKIQTLLNIQKINKEDNEEKSINSFLQLKAYLKELISDKAQNVNQRIEGVIFNFAQKIKNIINNNDDIVDDVFFTVYYKSDNQTNYTFFIDKNNIRNNRNYYNALKERNSLTYMMGNNDFMINKYHYSNFEILKSKKGELISRNVDKKLTKKIESNFQFKIIKSDKGILLIRITKINSNNKDVFQTLAVITIYLKKGRRINEKRLRLLLALRQQLSTYFAILINGTTIMDLINLQSDRELIINRSHSLNGYKTNILLNISLLKEYEHYKQSIINKKNKLPLKNKSQIIIKSKYQLAKEAEISLNASFAQIQMINKDSCEELVKSADELSQYLTFLLKSNIIGGKMYTKNKFNIDINHTLVLNSFYWDIIFPELIINIKKNTGSTDEVLINIYYDSKDEFLIFKNTFNTEKNLNINGGFTIIHNLMILIHNINIDELTVTEINYEISKYFIYKYSDNQKFEVKLKMKKNENINN